MIQNFTIISESSFMSPPINVCLYHLGATTVQIFSIIDTFLPLVDLQVSGIIQCVHWLLCLL